MSTSLLYHGFGIRGYTYVKTEYEAGKVIFTICQERGDLRCAICGSRRVVRRGSQLRRFRSLPIGRRLPLPDDVGNRANMIKAIVMRRRRCGGQDDMCRIFGH